MKDHGIIDALLGLRVEQSFEFSLSEELSIKVIKTDIDIMSFELWRYAKEELPEYLRSIDIDYIPLKVQSIADLLLKVK